MKEINRFVGEFSFLNNFYKSTVWIEGDSYPTAEHAYQSFKAKTQSEKKVIRESKTPIEAKRLGKSFLLEKDWDEKKIQSMETVLREKFSNPFLMYLLKNTSGKKLINENFYNDRFWGVYKGEGKNWLGVLLMKIRDEKDDSICFDKERFTSEET